MKLHNHVIIEEPRGGIVWYPRWFFHLYRGPEYGERRILDGHLEFVLRKPTAEFGFSFEVGTRGSETPFDGHVKVAGTALYWGIKQGSALADRITQLWCNRQPNRLTQACLDNTCACPPYRPGATFKRHHGRNGQPYEHRYDGRRLSVYTYTEGGCELVWDLWTLKNGGSIRDFADWRHGRVSLNPLDHLFGQKRYWYDDVDTANLEIQMPEATYPVKVTLQRQRFGRPKLPGRHLKSWSVDVDAPKGIPYRRDDSGWKGDRVYGFGVKLRERRRDWTVDAKAAIEARILRDRAESGFRKPDPVEAG